MRKKPGRPLVKICGITNVEDAKHAARLGADALGFIFATSPRQAKPSLLHELKDLDVLKIGDIQGDDCAFSAVCYVSSVAHNSYPVRI